MLSRGPPRPLSHHYNIRRTGAVVRMMSLFLIAAARLVSKPRKLLPTVRQAAA
jgi:hypothetical protein